MTQTSGVIQCRNTAQLFVQDCQGSLVFDLRQNTDSLKIKKF